MNLKLSDLWQWQGTVDRGEYAFWGFLLFAVKYNLDRLIAALYFHRYWSLLNYLFPKSSGSILSITGGEATFYRTLLLVALPFIWSGVVLTVRRLRSIRLPEWLSLVFFLPVVNLFFFLLLCIIPSQTGNRLLIHSKQRPGRWDGIIPDHPVGSAALSIVLNAICTVLLTVFSVHMLKNYGWGLFVGLPFSLGFGSVLIYTYHRPRSFSSCVLVSVCSILLSSMILLVVAVEGLVCLLMAAPLSLGLAVLGGVLAYALQFRPHSKEDTSGIFSAMVLLVPILMGAESFQASTAPVLEVRTAVEVDATPEQVWRHVVEFSELPPPREWLFRIGIAYPMQARIQGSGPGALRRCIFSTGAFTEPIQVWNEPRLLKFSVTANPAPMQEWTPYHQIHPPHLTGFLVSRGGQFLLTPLPNGRTLLEGTTWYQHHMWPASYWRLWSDFIIHRIHQRVLDHVKHLSEQGDPV